MPSFARVVGPRLGLLMILAATRAEVEAPPAPAAVPETTGVAGRVSPELVGRWLLVHDARLPTGKVRPFTRLFAVTPGAEHLDLRLHRVLLPDELKRRVEAAAATGGAWRPTPDDLELITKRWDDLPPIPSDLAHIDNELYGPDAFTDDLKRDEETRDSDAAIVTKEFFSGSEPVKSTIVVYGIRETAPAEFAGTFVSTSIATAPFPVPITLRGSFRAYRLGPSPARSWVTRVLDVFRGCGRR